MWLIAQIHGIASTVDERLKRNGFETFLPTYTDGGKISALYPGYSFVGYVRRWPLAARVDGVVRILGDGENPHIVQDEIIEKLRGITVLESKKQEEFKPRQAVRIRSGPWQGLIGEFHGKKSRGERSVIILDFLGGPSKITLRTDQIEGLPPASPPSP